MAITRWVLCAAMLSACGGGSTTASSGRTRTAAPTPPPRPNGCPIEIVREGVPSRPTHLVGHVVARCTGDAAQDETRCTRNLQDQACRLGGEVIWDVRSAPMADGEGREMRAEAAYY